MLTLAKHAVARLAKYSFGSVQADIDPASEAGRLMAVLRQSINDGDLTGKGREGESHVTARYGVMDNDVEDLRAYLSSLEPFTITFGMTRIFPPSKNSDGAAVIYVEINSPELEAINAELPKHANYKDSDFEYHPHATIAYVDPEAAWKYIGSDALTGITYKVSALTMCFRTGPKEVVPFGITATIAKVMEKRFLTIEECRQAYRAAYGDRDPKEVMREVLDEQEKRFIQRVAKAYKLEGETMFQGLSIAIETDKGSTRSGVDKNGKPWSVTLTWPYGYIRGTEGVDGDHVDCFIGPNPNATHAYVIHTSDPHADPYPQYDEDKVMLGWDSPEAATTALLDNYTDAAFFRGIEALPMDEFKEQVLDTRGNPHPIQIGKSKGIKTRKDGALYVFQPDAGGKYQCDQCPWFIPSGGLGKSYCRLFGVGDEVKAIGTCSYWVFGNPSTDQQPEGFVTPAEAGYVENKDGFSCARCVHFSEDKEDCEAVDKNSPGDTPGKILANACCGNWAKESRLSKLSKARRKAFPPKVRAAEKRMASKVKAFLGKVKAHVISTLREDGRLSKAVPRDLLNRLLDINWKPLADDLEGDLSDVAQYGAERGLAQLEMTDTNMIASANTIAADWAANRAAELIGMRRVNGMIVENPNPKWAISETTRQEIQSIVEKAFLKETPIETLADEIQDAGGFSDYRAEMIARTEAAAAQGQGNLLGWKASGLDVKVAWLMSWDHDDGLQCNCTENADNGPYELGNVPEFPDHPNCWCSLAPVVGQAPD